MATIVHAFIGYFVLLFTVRILARRPGGQMTVFEFVIVFLIGGVIILSTVGNDRSITNCTCAVIAVGFMHRLVSWAKSKSPRIGAVTDGTPLVLYKSGEWQERIMRATYIDREDVLAVARTKGVRSLEGIQYAILERNGGISIIKVEEEEE